MVRMIGYMFLLQFLATAALCGGPAEGNPALREKLVKIWRLQDQRLEQNDTLLGYLHDADPEVRWQAAVAFGSLQDTAAVPALLPLLRDPSVNVVEAAAFALAECCQNGSEELRKKVAGELTARANERPGSDPAAIRMLVETGKIASEGLIEREITLRVGQSNAMDFGVIGMIARSAIRGLIIPAAVDYLISHLHGDQTDDWRSYYALQRMRSFGRQREVFNILQAEVRSGTDPLVLMNCALALAKIPDSLGASGPLMTLARQATDWRVRVNAWRGLAKFTSTTEILDASVRGMEDPHPEVVLAAIDAYGTLAGKDRAQIDRTNGTSALRRILQSPDRYPPQVRGEALVTLARTRGAAAVVDLRDVDQNPVVEAQRITALGMSGSPDALAPLLRARAGDVPRFVVAALDGIMELARSNTSSRSLLDTAFAEAVTALRSSDMAVRTTAASMLGDSLLLRPASVPPLIAALGSMHLPDDIEAYQECVTTLTKLKDTSAIVALEKFLRGAERAVTHPAAIAIRSLRGMHAAPEEVPVLPPPASEENLQLLRTLPDTTRLAIRTSRGEMTAELHLRLAPMTVVTLVKLIGRHYFDGLNFHRVVPNFVIQGGDPRGDGWGGPGFTIRSEFSPAEYETGSIGIASAGKDTEGSQWFVTHSPQPHLDGRYTLCGKVVKGMEVVNSILVGDTIESVRIVP